MLEENIVSKGMERCLEDYWLGVVDVRKDREE